MGDDSPVTVTSMTTGRAKPDAVVVSAIDAARAALLEDVPAADVGEHLGAQVEGERVATHRSPARAPATAAGAGR